MRQPAILRCPRCGADVPEHVATLPHLGLWPYGWAGATTLRECGWTWPSLAELGARGAALPVLDARPADEILGYDEHGVPR